LFRAGCVKPSKGYNRRRFVFVQRIA
jgi:hypothetical protein